MEKLGKIVGVFKEDTDVRDIKGITDLRPYLKGRLKEYNDIEEKIGIDLITKDKVEQSYNVYYKKYTSTLTLKYDEIELCRINSFRREGIDVHLLPFDEKIFFLPYNEYGKTWALTKEELKNE